MTKRLDIIGKHKASKWLFGVALFSAITASLRCITPVLVLVAGVGGAASTFSWLEPIRPYLTGHYSFGFCLTSTTRTKKNWGLCSSAKEISPKLLQEVITSDIYQDIVFKTTGRMLYSSSP